MEYIERSFIQILQPLNCQKNSLVDSVTAKMFVSRLNEKMHQILPQKSKYFVFQMSKN